MGCFGTVVYLSNIKFVSLLSFPKNYRVLESIIKYMSARSSSEPAIVRYETMSQDAVCSILATAAAISFVARALNRESSFVFTKEYTIWVYHNLLTAPPSGALLLDYQRELEV
ncbi:hypothetical protein TNCV_3443101 [Trichonephila clavipes]|nr:hypothetical protein TNCV_3443101 [Trichonephila clavipes]